MPPGLDVTPQPAAPHDSESADVSHIVPGREVEAIVATYSFKRPKKARRRILKAVRRVCKELGQKRPPAAEPTGTSE